MCCDVFGAVLTRLDEAMVVGARSSVRVAVKIDRLVI